MPSFDVVSEMDQHEVSNAVDQANREVGTRFDFKGADAKYSFDKEKKLIKMKTESDFQLGQMLDILKIKLSKRGVDLGHLKEGEPVIQHKTAEQTINLIEGIETNEAKKLVKLIKAEKFKVQAAIQGDQLRVTGKKRDDLQAVMAFLTKQEEVKLPLQYQNFRD